MWRRIIMTCLFLPIAAGALAAPPLTDAQRTQFETAVDGGVIEQGALYPLLDNTLQWDPFDDRGATIPDYDAIRAAPDAHRGQVFLIEGIFVDQGTHRFSRPDPRRWGDHAVRWVVKYNPDPLGDGDDVVVVLFPDPRGKMVNPPRPQQPVRFPARFYMRWSTTEKQTGELTDFLVFVAPPASLTDTPGSLQRSAGGGGGAATAFVPLLVLLVVVALAVWWIARRSLSGRAATYRPPSQHLHPHRRESVEVDAEADIRTDLPEDPAEAMRVLEAEHKAVENQPMPEPKDPVAALRELEAHRKPDD